MSLTQRVSCSCGTSFEVPEISAAQRVKCPQCGALQRVPGFSLGRDAVFERDVYWIHQRVLRISQAYDICDESGEPVAYAERPAHAARRLVSAVGGGLAFCAVLIGGFGLGELLLGPEAGGLLVAVVALLGIAAAVAAGLVVGVALSVRRHVTVYRDDTKQEELLIIGQDDKVALPYARYTVRDAEGALLGRLSEHQFTSLLRKCWTVHGAQGEAAPPEFLAREDALLRAVLRRFLGPLFGLLRTQFELVDARGGARLGEFRRELTLRDRYTLDLSADRQRRLDRRLALAVGILLDSGEGR